MSTLKQGDELKGGWRRVGPSLVISAVLAASLVTMTATLAPTPARANETFQFVRAAGNDRYETASFVAHVFARSTDNAVIATGETFPDALAGSYIAGALTAPIILTQRNSLPPSSATTLSDLQVKHVTLLGGTGAVSSAVEDDLKAKGMQVERIAGSDRYDTARVLSEKVGASAVGTADGKKTAILASGENFPDAIAAGPLSFAGRLPTLLTTKDSLSAAAKEALSKLGIEQVLILGGTASISPTVEGALVGAGMSVVRLAGVDRSDTAAKIADFAIAKLAFSNKEIGLARGTAFPDALAAGATSGKYKVPTLLAAGPDTLGAPTEAWLKANAATLVDGVIFGGLNAISRATQAAAEIAAGKKGDAPTLTITEGPEDNAVAASDKPVYKGTATDDVAVDKIEVKVDTGSFSTTDVTCDGCSTPDAKWTYAPSTALSSGKHTITFHALNAAGAASSDVARTVNVDTSKPTLDSLSANGGNKTVTAIFSKEMDCSTVTKDDFTVKFGTTAQTEDHIDCTAPSDSTIGIVLISAPTSGQTVSLALTGEVKDLSGNVADPKTVSGVAKDSPPPTIAVTGGPADNARTNQTSPVYSGTASDDGVVQKVQARIDYSATNSSAAWLDASCGACATTAGSSVTWQFTRNLGTGTHTIEFRSLDNSGSESTEHPVRHVFIDTTAPTYNGASANTQTSIATAEFSEPIDCATAQASDFVVQGNDDTDHPRTITNVACPGSNVDLTVTPRIAGGSIVTITVVAGATITDVAGNAMSTSTASSRSSSTLSNQGPTVDITGAPSSPRHDKNVVFTGRATDPDGVVQKLQYEYHLAGGSGTFSDGGFTCTDCGKASATWTWSPPQGDLPSDGTWIFRFQAIDGYNKAGPESSRTIVVDNQGPVLNAVTAQAGSFTVSATFNEALNCATVEPSDFTVTIGSAAATIGQATCSQNNVALSVGTAPTANQTVTVNVLSDATHSIEDPGGNKAPAAQKSTTAGTTTARAPTMSVTAPSSPTRDTTPTFTVQATDDQGGMSLTAHKWKDGQTEPTDWSSQYVLCSPTCQAASATWVYDVTDQLPDGTWNFRFRVMDSDGFFTTDVKQIKIDTTGPTFLSVDGSSLIPQVTATFSEDLDENTVTDADFEVRLDGGNDPVSILNVSESNGVVTLTLATPPTTSFTVTLKQNAVVTDVVGNAALTNASVTKTKTF